MRYIIHASESRLWYVNGYLVPSIMRQGIGRDNIIVYSDKHGLGNLESCMRIFGLMPNSYEGSWHLQDDVIISEDFAERTSKAKDNCIISGFSSIYDLDNPGEVTPEQMWYSFPCIYIPNNLARECAGWYYETARKDVKYKSFIDMRNGDDYIFQEFVKSYYPEYSCINMVPNIVNHIDFLIGGSLCNKSRKEKAVMSRFWRDDKLLEDVWKWIKEHKQ